MSIHPSGVGGIIDATVGSLLQLDCRVSASEFVEPELTWSYEIGPELFDENSIDFVPIQKSGHSLIISTYCITSLN